MVPKNLNQDKTWKSNLFELKFVGWGFLKNTQAIWSKKDNDLAVPHSSNCSASEWPCC